MNSKSQYNYISAIDDVPAPPLNIDAPQPQQAIVSDATIGKIVVSANFAVTVLIIVAMLVDGRQVELAIYRGILYFGVSTPVFLLIITGGLAAMINVWQKERTERNRVRSYERVALAAIEWRRDVERNRTNELQAQAMPLQLTRRIAALETELLQRAIAVDPLHTPHTFVTPYSNVSEAAHSDMGPQVDASAQEAVAWASQLFGDTGLPDPKKLQLVGEVNDLGRLRIKVIGSKRGGGSREAGLFLLHHGAIQKVTGGFRFDLRHYPSREALRNLL